MTDSAKVRKVLHAMISYARLAKPIGPMADEQFYSIAEAEEVLKALQPAQPVGDASGRAEEYQSALEELERVDVYSRSVTFRERLGRFMADNYALVMEALRRCAEKPQPTAKVADAVAWAKYTINSRGSAHSSSKRLQTLITAAQSSQRSEDHKK